jgi:hypothetical protein
VQSINPAAVAFVSDEPGNAVLMLTSGVQLAVRGDAGEVSAFLQCVAAGSATYPPRWVSVPKEIILSAEPAKL